VPLSSTIIEVTDTRSDTLKLFVLMGTSVVNKFTEHSQDVTANNYNSLTGLHTLKITVTTAHKVKSSMSAFASRCLVTNLSWLTLHS
jgi:hypothetical protein